MLSVIQNIIKMKKIFNNKIIIVVLTLVVGGLLGWFIKPSHTDEEVTTEAHDHSGAPETWTCSMHPQIRQGEPGQCPICGMDLIPVEEGDDEGIDPDAVSMSETAMLLAGVRTSVVSQSQATKTINLNGKIQEDERMVVSQTSHVPGRVEQLNVNFTGDYVRKGQVLARIYSPELVTAQEELFVAKKYEETQPSLFKSAKDKLKNWKLSESQIEKILSGGKPIESFPITADVSGYVVSKNVNLGDYINRGQAIYKVADLSRVWVLFDVYEADMPWIKKGDEITFTVSSLPGQQFEGKVSFIDPTIDPKTRVAKARVEVKNSDMMLKPEMFASGKVISTVKNASDALVVPKSAVMWTGERSVVYVKNSSDNGINFIMREITLGPALGETYLVREGLQPGEEIATSGTFSIDAAAQLAGKPSMMSPEGGTVMTGHNHGEMSSANESMQMENTKMEMTYDVDDKFKKQIKAVYSAYLPVKDALVASNAAQVQQSATKLKSELGNVNMELLKGEAHNVWMSYLNPLQKAIDKMTSNLDLKVQREALIPLTNNLFKSIKTFEVNGLQGYYQFCPMADDNKGAYWLSAEDDVKNPYFGDAMLTCGEVVEEIE